MPMAATKWDYVSWYKRYGQCMAELERCLSLVAHEMRKQYLAGESLSDNHRGVDYHHLWLLNDQYEKTIDIGYHCFMHERDFEFVADVQPCTFNLYGFVFQTNTKTLKFGSLSPY